MPVQPMTFPLLSFDEANPALVAMQKMAQTRGLQQQAKKLGIENEYAPQMQQAELGIKQAQVPYYQNMANLTGEQAKYYGPKTQSEMALQGGQLQQALAQAGLLGEQTKYYGPNVQSEMDARSAQAKEALANAAYQGIKTQYYPEELQIEKDKAKQQQSRFGNVFQMTRFLNTLPPAERAAWISQHPNEMSEIGNALGNEVLAQYYPGSQQNAPGQYSNMSPIPQAGQQNYPGQVPGQQQGSQQGQPNNLGFSTSPEQAEKFALATQMQANRKQVSPYLNKRVDAAIALDSWLLNNKEKYADRIDNAFKYAGAIGKGKRYVDAMARETPEAYEDYTWFKTAFAKAASAQTRNMEGLGATDTQIKSMEDLVDTINQVGLTPKASKNVFNKNVNTILDISRSVYDAGEPINKGVYEKLHGFDKLSGDYVGESKSKSSQAQGKPDLQTFLREAKKENPDYSDEEITNYYYSTYGKG